MAQQPVFDVDTTPEGEERYTPRDIVEAARATMGDIHLDPASCELANRYVKATTYFNRSNDGLTLPWYGNIFVNHPYGRTNNKLWVGKMLNELVCRNIEQLICVTYASTSEEWFIPLKRCANAICYIDGRTRFFRPTRHGGIEQMKGAQKGVAVSYFGDSINRFAGEFRKMGTVVSPWGYTSLAQEYNRIIKEWKPLRGVYG